MKTKDILNNFYRYALNKKDHRITIGAIAAVFDPLNTNGFNVNGDLTYTLIDDYNRFVSSNFNCCDITQGLIRGKFDSTDAHNSYYSFKTTSEEISTDHFYERLFNSFYELNISLSSLFIENLKKVALNRNEDNNCNFLSVIAKTHNRLIVRKAGTDFIAIATYCSIFDWANNFFDFGCCNQYGLNWDAMNTKKFKYYKEEHKTFNNLHSEGKHKNNGNLLILDPKHVQFVSFDNKNAQGKIHDPFLPIEYDFCIKEIEDKNEYIVTIGLEWKLLFPRGEDTGVYFYNIN